MTLIEAQQRIKSLNVPLFQTSDVAICLGITRLHASKLLGRLVSAGVLLSLARGLWGFVGSVDPLLLPESLTAPAPAYVSLYSALFYHGMIAQIPENIYAVSLARTRRYKTPLGTISIHHLHESFFFGFESVGEWGIKMATPEKALLDTLYLYTARSGWFKKLPELNIPSAFNKQYAFEMIKKIPSLRTRSMVQKKLERIVPPF
jgi:predicted transcriptional regulator of viral defense system